MEQRTVWRVTRVTEAAWGSAVPRPSPAASRLARHFLTLSSGEGLAKAAAFLAFAYLARTLGPTHFGYAEFAISIVTVLALVVDCGLGTYSAREAAKHPASAARLGVHIILIHLVLAGACVAVLLGFVAVIDKPGPVKALTLLYGLSLFAWSALVPGVFQGCGRMQPVALASAARWLVFAAGVFLLVHGPGAVLTLPLVEVGAVSAAGAVYAIAGARTFGVRLPRISPAFALALVRQAWPIGASELVWAAKMYAATITLGLLAAAADVGLFGAALRLVLSAHTFVWLYFCSLLPALARRSQQGPADTASLLRGSLRLTAWLSGLICLAATVAAQPVVTLVYGAPFAEASPVFAALVWLLWLALVSGHYRYTLIAAGRQRLELLTALCGAGSCIALNAALVPLWGLFGAVVALLASETLIWGMAYGFVRRAGVRLAFWAPVGLSLLCGAGLTAVVYLVPTGERVVAAAAAVGLYGIILVVTQPRLLGEVRRLAGWSNR